MCLQPVRAATINLQDVVSTFGVYERNCYVKLSWATGTSVHLETTLHTRSPAASAVHHSRKTQQQLKAAALVCRPLTWEPADCGDSCYQTGLWGRPLWCHFAGCCVWSNGHTAPRCPLPACCSVSRSAMLQRLPAPPAPKAQVTAKSGAACGHLLMQHGLSGED